MAKKFGISEGLDDNQNHNGQQHEHRHFVEEAEPDMALRVAVLGKHFHQMAAIEMIGDESGHQRDLGMYPAAEEDVAMAQPQPQAGDDGRECRWA